MKDYLKALEKLLPYKNGTTCLNYIYIDCENYVCSDTRILITRPHNLAEEYYNSFIDNQKTTKVLYKDKYLDPIHGKVVFKTRDMHYVDYKHVLVSSGNFITLNTTLIPALYHLTSKTDICIDYVNYSQLFKVIDKTFPEVTKIFYNEKDLPITVYFSDNSTVTIMPYVL